ncbi:50S ribosomal protein L22 [Hydrogenobaculum acidophilum]
MSVKDVEVVSKAIHKNARISPLKASQVLRLLRGKPVEYAMYQLSFMNKKAAVIIKKVLKSAISNAEQKGIDATKLIILEAKADKGIMFRRWMPRAHGRATMMRKNTSHITIVLGEPKEMNEEAK